MSASGATTNVAVLPFPKCASSNYTTVLTPPYTNNGICVVLTGITEKCQNNRRIHIQMKVYIRVEISFSRFDADLIQIAKTIKTNRITPITPF